MKNEIRVCSITEAEKEYKVVSRNLKFNLEVYKAIENMKRGKAMIVTFNAQNGMFGVKLANRFRNRKKPYTISINSLSDDGRKWRIIKN
jgi:hypothetical protein